MNPSIELSLIVRRYLRRCHRDGDIEPLTAAGLLPPDRDLLFETAYWRGCESPETGHQCRGGDRLEHSVVAKIGGNSSPA